MAVNSTQAKALAHCSNKNMHVYGTAMVSYLRTKQTHQPSYAQFHYIRPQKNANLSQLVQGREGDKIYPPTHRHSCLRLEEMNQTAHICHPAGCLIQCPGSARPTTKTKMKRHNLPNPVKQNASILVSARQPGRKQRRLRNSNPLSRSEADTCMNYNLIIIIEP